jgi:hypothetical protein
LLTQGRADGITGPDDWVAEEVAADFDRLQSGAEDAEA